MDFPDCTPLPNPPPGSRPLSAHTLADPRPSAFSSSSASGVLLHECNIGSSPPQGPTPTSVPSPLMAAIPLLETPCAHQSRKHGLASGCLFLRISLLVWARLLPAVSSLSHRGQALGSLPGGGVPSPVPLLDVPRPAARLMAAGPLSASPLRQ